MHKLLKPQGLSEMEIDSGNLDPDLSWEIMGLFGQFNRFGVTVLVATHDVDLIRRMGERVLVLSHGELAGDTR